MQFLELEYANIVVGNMYSQLKEKLIAQECSNLTHVATRTSRIKHFILEKEQRKANRASKSPHIVFIVDSDGPIEVIDFSNEQSSKVMAAKILKARPY